MDLFTNLSISQTGIILRIPRQHMQLQTHQQALLKQPAPLFLQCEDIAVSETELAFTYQKPAGHLPFSQICHCTTLEKYLILIRLGRFVSDLKKRFSTSFDPRNIFFTRTLDIAFLLRILPGTIPEFPRTPLDEFNDFKALVLSVIQDKCTFNELAQCGLEIAAPTPLAQAIISAANPQDLEGILTEEYERNYLAQRQNRIGFSKKLVMGAAVAVGLLVVISGVSAFFAFSNGSLNKINASKNAIYENHFDGNKTAIVESSKVLKDKDMDPNLAKIVADALIVTKEPENLQRAFSLDPSRSLEIIDRLILLNEYDRITTLESDDPLIQVYRAFYAKDYSKVLALAENNASLKKESRAQILRSKACLALGNYPTAAAVLLEEIKSDLESYLDTAKSSREAALNNSQTDLEHRDLNVRYWDDMIKLIEDIQKAKRVGPIKPVPKPEFYTETIYGVSDKKSIEGWENLGEYDSKKDGMIIDVDYAIPNAIKSRGC